MKRKRLPSNVPGRIASAMSYGLAGNLDRAAEFALKVDINIAGLDPLSAPVCSEQIEQELHQATGSPNPICRLISAAVALFWGERWQTPMHKREVPSLTPELAPILSCDPDSSVREAAIRAWVPPARSRFHLAMLVVRVHDPVPEVRQAAQQRLPEFLAAATEADRVCVSVLILDQERMGRIDEDCSALEALIDSPPARGETLADFKLIDGWHSLRLFSLVLRQPWIDSHLVSLAREAKTPLVRALALRALVTGVVKWRIGIKEVWHGGMLGGMRSVREYAQRTVHNDADVADAVVVALTDRRAAVRRVAAEALGDKPEAFQNAAALAVPLLNDRSRSVVERAAFVVRRSGPDGERLLADRVAAGKDRHGAIRAVLERGSMLKEN